MGDGTASRRAADESAVQENSIEQGQAPDAPKRIHEWKLLMTPKGIVVSFIGLIAGLCIAFTIWICVEAEDKTPAVCLIALTGAVITMLVVYAIMKSRQEREQNKRKDDTWSKRQLQKMTASLAEKNDRVSATVHRAQYRQKDRTFVVFVALASASPKGHTLHPPPPATVISGTLFVSIGVGCNFDLEVGDERNRLKIELPEAGSDMIVEFVGKNDKQVPLTSSTGWEGCAIFLPTRELGEISCHGPLELKA